MAFINETQVLGSIFGVMSSDLTGSMFLSVMMALLVLLFIGFAFRIPLELQTAYVLPLLLGMMAYSKDYVAVGGVALLFLGVVLSKIIFFNNR